MTYRAVLKSFRLSLQYLISILKSKDPNVPYLFSAEVKANVPDLLIFPNLSGLQQTLNEVVRSILIETRGIKTWPTPMFESTIQKHEDEKIDEKDVDEDGEKFHGLVPAQTQDVNPSNFFVF